MNFVLKECVTFGELIGLGTVGIVVQPYFRFCRNATDQG